jgi:hypothetical protein
MFVRSRLLFSGTLLHLADWVFDNEHCHAKVEVTIQEGMNGTERNFIEHSGIGGQNFFLESPSGILIFVE